MPVLQTITLPATLLICYIFHKHYSFDGIPCLLQQNAGHPFAVPPSSVLSYPRAPRFHLLLMIRRPLHCRKPSVQLRPTGTGWPRTGLIQRCLFISGFLPSLIQCFDKKLQAKNGAFPFPPHQKEQTGALFLHTYV